ncbi:hypothetical protein Ddye_031211 [Dipteronia dyeriana]|uniref:Uncharacterized protein n=1 Tax=Dipteronia dyeriana TaxID=168575 RepID=A0AAD9WM59_9ROSI|nr:hypothetical protein Ddye_031211 [Dipteronia dyeriana]
MREREKGRCERGEYMEDVSSSPPQHYVDPDLLYSFKLPHQTDPNKLPTQGNTKPSNKAEQGKNRTAPRKKQRTKTRPEDTTRKISTQASTNVSSPSNAKCSQVKDITQKISTQTPANISNPSSAKCCQGYYVSLTSLGSQTSDHYSSDYCKYDRSMFRNYDHD